jgi:hypothetical protein
MKNSNDTIGNRARKLPACTAVPQPTAPPCTPVQLKYTQTITKLESCVYHFDTELYQYIIVSKSSSGSFVPISRHEVRLDNVQGTCPRPAENISKCCEQHLDDILSLMGLPCQQDKISKHYVSPISATRLNDSDNESQRDTLFLSFI